MGTPLSVLIGGKKSQRYSQSGITLGGAHVPNPINSFLW
jgi:hypothetical protein